jgi:Co/Zn/Cd efflux system component
MFGGIGVVGAIVTSITIGSGLIYIMYHRIYNISYAELFAGKSLILSTVLALVVSFVVFKTFGARAGILEVNIIALAVFALFTAVPLWKHPTRRFLLNWFYKAFRPERDGVISA